MSVRIAYGEKKNIYPAIASGVIPKSCIIITKDEKNPELLYYDKTGFLSTVSWCSRFESLDKVKEWIKDYPCEGYIVSVKSGNKWEPYIVQDGGEILPIGTLLSETIIPEYATQEEIEEMLDNVFLS